MARQVMIVNFVAGLPATDYRPVDCVFKPAPIGVTELRREVTSAPIFGVVGANLFDRFKVRLICCRLIGHLLARSVP